MGLRLSEDEYAALLGKRQPKAAKRLKYGNEKTVVDNVTFDSKKEAARYEELKIMMRAGEITTVELQPKFDLVINGVKICTYRGDFAYYRIKMPKANVVEDVKGMRTPVYKLKKKLMLAVHGIEIQEI